MPFQEMNIKGAWVHSPIRYTDERGSFVEQFKLSHIESELGRSFTVKQVNQSVSRKGVIRGIHYTASPEGQAKYVSCPAGAIWDVVVDLREGSPTYGKWDSIKLSAENGLSLFISEGLGHAFLSLEDASVVNYLCSSEYDPDADGSINAFSPELNIEFTKSGLNDFILSPKDAAAINF